MKGFLNKVFFNKNKVFLLKEVLLVFKSKCLLENLFFFKFFF